MTRRNRTEADPKDDELGSAQCGKCRSIIPIEGALASDWGVCSNPRSPFDGRIMWEHDACAEYESADGWVL